MSDLKLTLYTSPSCRDCLSTKRDLNKRGIDYEEIDLSTNPELVDALRAENFQKMPVVKVGDRSWSGYQPDEIAALD